MNNAHNPIQQAHLSVISTYNSLDSEFIQEKVKTFMASDTVRKVEESIEKQYQLSLLGDQVAMERVKEGMAFWKRLILRKMMPA